MATRGAPPSVAIASGSMSRHDGSEFNESEARRYVWSIEDVEELRWMLFKAMKDHHMLQNRLKKVESEKESAATAHGREIERLERERDEFKQTTTRMLRQSLGRHKAEITREVRLEMSTPGDSVAVSGHKLGEKLKHSQGLVAQAREEIRRLQAETQRLRGELSLSRRQCEAARNKYAPLVRELREARDALEQIKQEREVRERHMARQLQEVTAAHGATRAKLKDFELKYVQLLNQFRGTIMSGRPPSAKPTQKPKPPAPAPARRQKPEESVTVDVPVVEADEAEEQGVESLVAELDAEVAAADEEEEKEEEVPAEPEPERETLVASEVEGAVLQRRRKAESQAAAVPSEPIPAPVFGRASVPRLPLDQHRLFPTDRSLAASVTDRRGDRPRSALVGPMLRSVWGTLSARGGELWGDQRGVRAKHWPASSRTPSATQGPIRTRPQSARHRKPRYARPHSSITPHRPSSARPRPMSAGPSRGLELAGQTKGLSPRPR